MKSLHLLLGALPLLPSILAQEAVDYTDAATSITLNTWNLGPVTWGMALPPNSLQTAAKDFIGLLTCATPTAASTGWCGLSLGGGMVGAPLLLAYPSPTASDPNRILTSFRWADEYGPPTLYTGDATLSQISSVVNATHYSVLFHCKDCLAWKQGETEGQVSTAEGMLVLGWAHHAAASPSNGACADNARVGQHAQQGMFGAMFNEGAVNAKYEQWTALAKGGVKGECGAAVATSAAAGVKTSVVVLLPTASQGVVSPGSTVSGGGLLPPASTGGVVLGPGIATSVVQLPPATSRVSSSAPILTVPQGPASSRVATPVPILTVSQPSIFLPTAIPVLPSSAILTGPKPSIYLPTTVPARPSSAILTVPKPSIWIPSTIPARPSSAILTVPKPSIYTPTTLTRRPSTTKTPATPTRKPTTPKPTKPQTTKPTKPTFWFPPHRPTTLTRLPRPTTTKGVIPPPVPPKPTRVPAVPAAGEGRCRQTYKVVKGDYCWLIATQNDMTLARLRALNPELECDPLQIGEVVCLRRG